MTYPQSKPLSLTGNEAFDELGREIAAQVEAGVAGSKGQASNGRAGVAVGPPATSLWGPSTTPITSPLQMLAQVADHGYKLHEAMLQLVGQITGEAPPPMRLREGPRPGGGLLPAIGRLAHEIEAQQIEIAGLISHLRGKL